MTWPRMQMSFPIQELQSLASRAELALNQRKDIRRDLRETLYRLIRKDFDDKSRGSSGAASIRWSPCLGQKATSAAQPIGVRTGQLRDSLQVEDGTGRIDLIASYTAPHAAAFNDHRPLLPEVTPSEWQDVLESQIKNWAEEQIRKEVIS